MYGKADRRASEHRGPRRAENVPFARGTRVDDYGLIPLYAHSHHATQLTYQPTWLPRMTESRLGERTRKSSVVVGAFDKRTLER